MVFIRAIFFSVWFWTLIYLLIGIGLNTNPPHYPSAPHGIGPAVIIHSVVQYFISVALWPLSLWSPTFTVGKWTGL